MVRKTCLVLMIMCRRTEKRMKIYIYIYNKHKLYCKRSHVLQAQKQMLTFSLYIALPLLIFALPSPDSMTLWTPQKCGHCRKWARKKGDKKKRNEMKQKRYMLSSNQDWSLFFFSLSLSLGCVTFIGNNLKYDAINNKRWQHTFFPVPRLHKSCLNKLENATINGKDIGGGDNKSTTTTKTTP